MVHALVASGSPEGWPQAAAGMQALHTLRRRRRHMPSGQASPAQPPALLPRTGLPSRVGLQLAPAAPPGQHQSVHGVFVHARAQVPPNGLVVYTGTITTDDGKEKKVNIDFEPFKPINTSLYLCDNKFHTEALNELLESDNKCVHACICIWRATTSVCPWPTAAAVAMHACMCGRRAIDTACLGERCAAAHTTRCVHARGASMQRGVCSARCMRAASVGRHACWRCMASGGCRSFSAMHWLGQGGGEEVAGGGGDGGD